MWCGCGVMWAANTWAGERVCVPCDSAMASDLVARSWRKSSTALAVDVGVCDSERAEQDVVVGKGWHRPKIAGVSDDTLPMSRSIWMMRLMRLAGNAPAADFRRRVRAPPSAAAASPACSLIPSQEQKKKRLVRGE